MRIPSTATRCRATAAGIAALVLAGCAGVPSQEMSDARRALDAAEAARAGAHASSLMDLSRAALGDAESALAASDYHLAKERALKARTAAIDARALSRARIDALAAIEEGRAAGRSVGGAEALLARAGAVAESGDVPRALRLIARAVDLAR